MRKTGHSTSEEAGARVIRPVGTTDELPVSHYRILERLGGEIQVTAGGLQAPCPWSLASKGTMSANARCGDGWGCPRFVVAPGKKPGSPS